MPHIIRDKTYTSHALMDEIVYNCKLILQSIVLKDESTANANETKNSLENSEVLLSIVNGTMKLEFFPLTVELLVDFGYSEFEAFDYVNDPSLIPESDRDNLLNFCCTDFVNNYVEENNYYRMLNGLPAFGTTEFDIYIKPEPDSGNMNSEEEERQKRYREKLVGVPIDQIFDFSKPLHEFTINQITTLDTLGILDLIKEDYVKNNKYNPLEYRYLSYLGSKKIDIITARSAAQWDIIYIPHVDYYVMNRFKELYAINRDIYLRRTNQIAYNVDSEYYEQMIMFIIVCQTFNDMVVDTPEWYIRRDIIDLRSVQYFLESNGVQFFADIPLRFQTRIVKNLNKLIKYKSTTQNILDILAIFDSENTIIYKYYLMKKNIGTDYDPEVDPGIYPRDDDPEWIAWKRLQELDCGNEEETQYVINTGDGNGNDRTNDPHNDINPIPLYDFDDDGTLPLYNWDFGNDDGSEAENTEETETYDEYYESSVRKVRDEYGNLYGLEFVKVPIDKEYDDYVRDNKYHEGYDEVVTQDKYWDGEDGHYYVRNQHCLKDFTVEGTKYMGLEFEVFIDQYLYQREYYLGLIFNNGINIEALKIAVPELRPDIYFNIRDLLVFLYCCNGLYTNEDIVVNNPYDYIDQRTEDQPEFQPYHDYDGGTYRYAEPYIEQDGHHPGDQLYDYHEYMDAGETLFASNIKQNTFYDYIRTDHQELFIDLIGRIYGFNMSADLDAIQDAIGFKHSKFGFERGYTLAELGVESFITKDKIETFGELYSIYENNTACYKKLKSWFQKASNRDERRVYDYVYYQLFTTPYSTEFYTMPDGTMAKTYDQVLMKYDYTLYTIYNELKSEADMDARISMLNDIVNAIIDTLNYYLNGDNLKYILTFVDNNSIDALLHYISEMINFFKSWKVYFLQPKTNFIIGDSGMYDDEGHRLSGSSGPEYIVTYGDQLGTYVERFWSVENERLTDSVIVKNHYLFQDQLKTNLNYNSEVVDIASHYVDHDILGDKDYDGLTPNTNRDEPIIIDAGEVDENSFSPYYVYNGGGVSARKEINSIEGGQVLDTIEYLNIDGGNINDEAIRFLPITIPTDSNIEKYYNVNGGWVTARHITDKTTSIIVDEGECINYQDTRNPEDIPYSRNRITIEARIADNDFNGLSLLDDGLFFKYDAYAKSDEAEMTMNDMNIFKNNVLQEITHWYDLLLAYTDINKLTAYIYNDLSNRFASANKVFDAITYGNLEAELVTKSEMKINQDLYDWFNKGNPFTWTNFDEPN